MRIRGTFLIAALLFGSLGSPAWGFLDKQDLGQSCFHAGDCAANVFDSSQKIGLEANCKLAQKLTCGELTQTPGVRLYSCSLEDFCKKTVKSAVMERAKGRVYDNLASFAHNSIDALGSAMKGVADEARGQGCNTSLPRKMEMIRKFQESLPPGENFTVPEGPSLEKMSCGELLKMFNMKADGVYRRANEKKLAQGEIADTDESRASREKNIEAFRAAIREKVREFEINLECYHPEVRAQIECEAASLVVLPAGTAAIKYLSKINALKRLASLTGNSKRVTKALEELESQGRVSQLTASSLSDSERIRIGERIIGRAMTEEQKAGLIRVHEIGSDKIVAQGGVYSPEQIAAKAREMKRLGFNEAERRQLIENWITGSGLDRRTVTAVLASNAYYLASTYQSNIQAYLSARDKSLDIIQSLEYREKSLSVLEKAKLEEARRSAASYSLLLADRTSALGDVRTANAFFKDAAQRLDKLAATEPGAASDTRLLSDRIQAHLSAGDTDVAVKLIQDGVKAHYKAEGFQTLEAAMEAKYKELFEEASRGANDKVLRNESMPGAEATATGFYVKQIRALKALDRLVETTPNLIGRGSAQGERARIQSRIVEFARELQKRDVDPSKI